MFHVILRFIPVFFSLLNKYFRWSYQLKKGSSSFSWDTLYAFMLMVFLSMNTNKEYLIKVLLVSGEVGPVRLAGYVQNKLKCSKEDVISLKLWVPETFF